MIRMRTVSVLPPANPEMSPTSPPITAETIAAANPTMSEILEPSIRSFTMSDPPPSRPSQCELLGGSNTSPTCSFGSSMNIGPKIATTTKSTMTVRPTIA